MKKVAVFFAIVLFLFCFCSCDFLRKVAGRPTSDEIKLRSAFIQAREKSEADSVKALELALNSQKTGQSDSLAGKLRLDSLGVNLSSVFRFGTPVKSLEHRYNLIVGVFRQRATATQYFNSYSSKGFSPSYIFFPGGETALCLGSSDSLQEVAGIVTRGRKAGVCPSDAWIFCKR